MRNYSFGVGAARQARQLILVATSAVALTLLTTACAQSVSENGASVSGATPPAEASESTSGGLHDDGAFAGAACLVGEWTADNSFFLSAIREFGPEVKSVEGEVVVRFVANDTMTTEYRDWRITAVTEGQQVTILRNRVDDGEYAAGEGTLSLKETTVTSTLVVSGDGFEMAVDAEPVNYPSATYLCDATQAVITTDDGDLQLVRR